MLVTLRFTASWSGELEVAAVEWATPAARRLGQARLRIPRSSPAFNPTYISEMGGSFVAIDHGLLGSWRGIVQSVTVDAWGADVTAMHISALMAMRCVDTATTFTECSAGVIVKTAVGQALLASGRMGYSFGTFTEGGGSIPGYAFTGQTLAQVVADMQAATGQEIRFNDNGSVDWIPSAGQMYGAWLVDDGDVSEGTVSTTADGRVTEVIARGNNNLIVSRTAGETIDAGLWAKQVNLTVSTSNIIELAAAAEQYLAVNRQPARTYRAKLRNVSGHWAGIREGDYVRLCLPTAGIGGATPLCRVLSRAASDADSTVGLTLQSIPTYDSSTLILAATRAASPLPLDTANDISRQISDSAAAATAPIGDARIASVSAAKIAGQIGATQIAAAAVDTSKTALTAQTTVGAAGAAAALPAAPSTYVIVKDANGTQWAVPGFAPT